MEFSKIEFGRWVGTQFFPSQRHFEEALKKGSLCLASKTRTLGDALIAASVAQKLKAKYPGLKIFTYNRAFNPVVTRHHPAFSGTAWFPRAVFGDDCNLGSGHLIQLKEQWFGLDVSSDPRPQIFLSENEKTAAKNWLVQNLDQRLKPLLFIHPWGHTWTQVLSERDWAFLIREYKSEFHVVQLGVEGHQKIEGVDAFFKASRRFLVARLLFALISQASNFIGVNSGPMHVAASFKIPSLILIQEGDPREIFEQRFTMPYYLAGNQTRGFLYECNEHFCLKTQDRTGLQISFQKLLQRGHS